MALLMNAGNLGVHVTICSEYSYLDHSSEQVPKYVRGQALARLISMRLGEQDIFKQRFMPNEKSPETFEIRIT